MQTRGCIAAAGLRGRSVGSTGGSLRHLAIKVMVVHPQVVKGAP